MISEAGIGSLSIDGENSFVLSLTPGQYIATFDFSLSEEIALLKNEVFSLKGSDVLFNYKRISKSYTLLTASRKFALKSIASTLLSYQPRHGKPKK